MLPVPACLHTTSRPPQSTPSGCFQVPTTSSVRTVLHTLAMYLPSVNQFCQYSLSAHYRPSRPSLQSTFVCSFMLFPAVLVALRRLPSRFTRHCHRNPDIKRLCKSR